MIEFLNKYLKELSNIWSTKCFEKPLEEFLPKCWKKKLGEFQEVLEKKSGKFSKESLEAFLEKPSKNYRIFNGKNC